ncbi:2-keto-3-deoxy-galactonokinase [Roseobacter denitrificans]|uniref:2-dehydro-3-deoxygalactonokinase, putative n=1 Tax=Roseobacter denitrificans (strain ATCC 33942 / OCh 114) TaxID=375451 RepID=Q165F0_ROSDO|nr:2-dehydro-3-deoxygalactonokinase [Roseobacter denitrificans]ABG32393.1 2-dehydro-3-deoxygalactonokinase, putative [Roseobacter denitrificans OCh 114]AVL51865.1 2-keto-3-deoxy-galactonokinase [Roseobacter denitrificans]SFF81230.1 2-dehydro-3-deoxygalactonokinase [Roseobacter denitrificans OCh 114]
MTGTCTPEWIALDWGTSNLRAFAMQGATVLERAESNAGMRKLEPAQFEPVLQDLIDPWLHEGLGALIACGMVGARQGWAEAPYRAVPCAPVAEGLTQITMQSGHRVHIVSGLSQTAPPDVMRGEETQIAGFLSLNPKWDGVLCMPGTHTKWVHLSAGEVVSFQTFMTGEIFALLSESSVLRHSVVPDTWDGSAFQDAVADSLSHPERMAAKLFALRAGDLLKLNDQGSARAALSGYLIGMEIAATRPYWLGQNLAILGMGAQAQAYQGALSAQGVPATMVDTERATLAGLTAVHRQLKACI